MGGWLRWGGVTLEAGFKPPNSDSLVFVKGLMYIVVYMDNLLIFGPDITDIKNVKA